MFVTKQLWTALYIVNLYYFLWDYQAMKYDAFIVKESRYNSLQENRAGECGISWQNRNVK